MATLTEEKKPFRVMRTLRSPQQDPSAKRKKRRRPPRWLLILAGALVLAGMVAASVLAAAGPVGRSNLTDSLRSLGRRGGAFPLPSGRAGILAAAQPGNSVALLSRTVLEVYANSGVQTLHQLHNYGSPVLRERGGRLLLFDRDSGQYALLSKTAELRSGVLPQNLLAGDLNRRGSVALASLADGALSEAVALDREGKELFSWSSKKEYIADLSLGDDDGSLALLLTGTEQAGLYSRLVAFTFGREEPTVDLRYDHTWLLRLEPLAQGGWIAVGEEMLTVIGKDGKKQDFSYDGRTLDGVSAWEGKLLAVLLRDWGRDRSLLRLYGPDGVLLQEQAFPQRVLGISCAGGKVHLRLEDRVLRLGRDGVFLQSQPLPAGTQDVLVAGRTVYALTVNEVEKFRTDWTEAEAATLG